MVLLSTTNQVEEPFGSFAEPIARAPKWLSGGTVGINKSSGPSSFIDCHAKEDKFVHEAQETILAKGLVNRNVLDSGANCGVLQKKFSSFEEKAFEAFDFGMFCHCCMYVGWQENLKRSLLKIHRKLRATSKELIHSRTPLVVVGLDLLGPRTPLFWRVFLWPISRICQRPSQLASLSPVYSKYMAGQK